MINLKIDYGFKKVFGTDENKSLTMERENQDTLQAEGGSW